MSTFGNSKAMLVTGGCGFIGSDFLRQFVVKYPDTLFVNIDALTYAGSVDKVFILATQNGTQLTINDGTTTLTPFLNFSQTHVYSVTNSIAYIKSKRSLKLLIKKIDVQLLK